MRPRTKILQRMEVVSGGGVFLLWMNEKEMRKRDVKTEGRRSR